MPPKAVGQSQGNEGKLMLKNKVGYKHVKIKVESICYLVLVVSNFLPYGKHRKITEIEYKTENTKQSQKTTFVQLKNKTIYPRKSEYLTIT